MVDPNLVEPPTDAFDVSGLKVPGFQLESPLGSGGFAVVARGTHEATGKPAAVKIAIRTDEVGAERFAREAQSMKEIGTPHVPELYDFGWLDDERPYIGMELLAGQPLSELILDLEEPMPAPRACALVRQILKVLASVHAKGWIHRDLKPDNIFVEDDKVRLLDFGLVRTLEGDSELTQEGTFVGTSEYCAPEQLTSGKTVDIRSDLYSVGVILYELLTLRPPFVGIQAEVEHGHVVMRPPDPRTFAPVPEPVAEIVSMCLSKSPDRRPASAPVLRQKLDRALATTERTGSKLSATIAEPLPTRTAIKTDGRRPVVLLVLETKGEVGRVSGEITAHSGVLVRQRGQRFTCAFIGAESNPVQSATAVATTLIAALGGRAAIHLAALRVRARRNGAVRVFGTDVDKPESWLPADWEGLVYSSPVAMTLPPNTLEPAEAEGFFRKASKKAAKAAKKNEAAPFVGQEGLLGQVQESYEKAFADKSNRLCTMLGAPGSGKSRLLEEIGKRVKKEVSDVKIYRMRARRAIAGDAEQPLRRILRAGLMLPDKPSETDVKLACKVLLGRESADEILPSLLMALGLGDHGRAPGRIRHDVTVAVGTALHNSAKTRPVAVIVDDADWADDTTLDALEYAMTRCQELPLWIIVGSGPRLLEARPTWGQRTVHNDEVEIPPLDEESASLLAAHLLQPVDRPPLKMLKRLASWAAYNPAGLFELVGSLHREGIVRQYEGGETWYVDEEALDKLPSSPVRQWAAARMVQMLPGELADLVRICAVLGAEFSLDEVDAVQRHLSSDSQVDPAVGLTQLTQRDVLVPGEGDRYAFADPSIQKGIYSQLGDEGKKVAHASAYDFWSRLPDAGTDQLHRIAYHAAHGNKVDAAITAYMALGAEAGLRNAHREGAAAYTSALELIEDEDSPLRLQVLISRGKARRGAGHYEGAVADLEAASELAIKLNDNESLVEAMTEEAGACDFSEQFQKSAELIDKAVELAEKGVRPYVRARLLCWHGVVSWRRGNIPLSVECLNMAAVLGRALNEHEAEVGPSLLLALALLAVDKPEAGLEVLSNVIMKCEAKGDYENLAMAHANRCEFWSFYKDVDRARADIERVKQLAEEGGFFIMELLSYFNLAELLLRLGDTKGALEATTEAYRQNHVRFKQNPLQVINLLHAHVLCHAGELDEAKRVLGDTGDGDEITGQWLAKTVRVATEEAEGEPWEKLLEFSRETASPEQVVTTLWLRARCEARAGRDANGFFTEAIEEALLIESDMASAIMQDRSDFMEDDE